MQKIRLAFDIKKCVTKICAWRSGWGKKEESILLMPVKGYKIKS